MAVYQYYEYRARRCYAGALVYICICINVWKGLAGWLSSNSAVSQSTETTQLDIAHGTNPAPAGPAESYMEASLTKQPPNPAKICVLERPFRVSCRAGILTLVLQR